jgi:alkylation response protein AidB-like acyl-CoA dehydrogenase
VSAPAPARPALADLVDRVAAVTIEHAERTDVDASFPVEALRELRETRLLGLLVPEEFGGLGGSAADVLTATTRLGREDMSVAMIFAMHCQQVAAVVGHATGRLRDELLPEIAAGHVYLASVTTETGKGGQLLSSAAELSAADGELVLDRFAPIVTGGAHADGFLITMLSPDAESAHQVSLVYAHRDQLEIAAAGEWQPLGMRASHSGALHLRGRLPDHQIVGEHGRFREIVSSTFGPMAHLGWSAAWLGTASGALSRVVALLRDPRARGSAKLDSELLLTRLATARQRLEVVHALLWHTADVVAREPDLTRPRVQLLINGLKVTASEQCHAVVEDLIDLVGMRHGYLRGSPTHLERALRDLRSAALNYSNDRLRLVDGKLALLDPEVRLD